MINYVAEQPPEGLDDEVAEYLVRQLENIAASLDSTNDFDGLYKYPKKYTDGMLRYAYAGDDFKEDGFYAVIDGEWKPVGSDSSSCILSLDVYTTDCDDVDYSKANIVYSDFYNTWTGTLPNQSGHRVLGLDFSYASDVGLAVHFDQIILKNSTHFMIADGTFGFYKQIDGTPSLYLINDGDFWSIDMTKV